MKRHPTKAQVQVVIDTLTEALPFSRKLIKQKSYDVAMLHSTIDKTCGSPMCHAGWYASIRALKHGAKPVNFKSGAYMIAKDLGFKSTSKLEWWAHNNPEIWGNNHGNMMFNSKVAFGNYDYIHLRDIVKHWKDVQKRLPK